MAQTLPDIFNKTKDTTLSYQTSEVGGFPTFSTVFNLVVMLIFILLKFLCCYYVVPESELVCALLGLRVRCEHDELLQNANVGLIDNLPACHMLLEEPPSMSTLVSMS